MSATGGSGGGVGFAVLWRLATGPSVPCMAPCAAHVVQRVIQAKSELIDRLGLKTAFWKISIEDRSH